MKKNILFLLTVTLVITLTACSKDYKTKVSTEETVLSEEETENITEIVSTDINENALSDDDIKNMQRVNDEIQSMIEKTQKCTVEERKEAADNLFNELIKKQLIKEDYSYDSDNSIISFEYECGAYGVVMLKEFDSELN